MSLLPLRLCQNACHTSSFKVVLSSHKPSCIILNFFLILPGLLFPCGSQTGLAYSEIGHTNPLYAISLTSWGHDNKPASVAQLDAPSDWRPGSHGFNPCWGWQHSFMKIDHEIFSTVILSLPLIQEGQLSVSGERMCTILVNRLED